MRIKFTEDAGCNLADLPRSAYGHTNFWPRANGAMRHYFPKSREAELPDDLAQRYIDQGAAILVKDKTIIWGERPDQTLVPALPAPANDGNLA